MKLKKSDIYYMITQWISCSIITTMSFRIIKLYECLFNTENKKSQNIKG